MEFTIYTAGSSEFLEIVLNACAMLTGSGSIDDMARIGALLGVAIISFQAVFRAQGIEFQKVGLMLVCYMMFYGPSVTTIVQDTTNEQVRVIDNIPIGPAFVGSLFSTVAYQISELSEQAFSTPGMTRYGLFSSLTTMSRVRDVLRNPVALDQFQNYRKAEGWDLGRSFEEYMTFCNFNPVFLRNNMSVDQLYRAGDVGVLFSNTSEAQYVYVYNQYPPQLMTCAAAGKALSTAMADVLPLVMDDVMQKGFSDQVQSGEMTNFAQMQASLDNSLQSFGLSNKKASDYVASSLIQRYFSQGRVDALNHWQERRAAMALQQSLSQQEIQWAGKGDSFKFYIKPMMAFVEGLVYAVAPFMAMVMLMGGGGVSSLAKFATLPLTSALCMPLLSFVNAFTLWFAGSKIQAILNGYDPISTGFAQMQLMDIDQALGTALGLGGYLASSVPVLAASIVGAGAIGVSSLLSGASSDSKFNSEDVQPKTQKPAPVLATESHYTADQMSQGVSVTGAVNNAEQISGQQAASALVQSTQAASHTATQALQQTTQSAVQHAASTTQGQQVLSNLGHQVASSLNLSSNSQYTDAANRLKGLGWSESNIAAGTFAASVGASAPAGLASGKLEDSERYQKMSSEQQQQTQQAMAQLTSAVQASSNDQTSYNSAEAFSRNSQSIVSESMSESLGKSLTDAKQAQEAYSTASKMESVFAASQSLNLKQAAVNSLGRGTNKAESAEALKEMAGRTLSGRAAYEAALKSNSIESLSTDLNEKKAMAAIRAMNQDGRLGDLVNSKMSPFDFHLDKVDAQRSSQLMSGKVDTSGLAGRVENGVNSVREAYASSNDMLVSGLEAQQSDGRIVVGEASEAHGSRVAESNDMNFGRLQAGNEDSPINKQDIDVKSVTPVEDTAKGFAQHPSASTSLAVEQIADKVADLGGVSKDNAAFNTVRNYVAHPIDSTVNAVHQIGGAIDSISSPSSSKSTAKEGPPKIE